MNFLHASVHRLFDRFPKKVSSRLSNHQVIKQVLNLNFLLFVFQADTHTERDQSLKTEFIESRHLKTCNFKSLTFKQCFRYHTLVKKSVKGIIAFAKKYIFTYMFISFHHFRLLLRSMIQTTEVKRVASTLEPYFGMQVCILFIHQNLLSLCIIFQHI